MPRATQTPLSSRNTGLPVSWALAWGLFTRSIREASSSDTRNESSSRQSVLLRNL